jgi:hypothetical protein
VIPSLLASGSSPSWDGIAHTEAGRGDSLDEPFDRFFRCAELATDQGDLKSHTSHSYAGPSLHRARMDRIPTAARNIAGENRDRTQFLTQ